MNANLLLLLNFASTWAMVGLIWLIQVVHYPLFAQVGKDQFKGYAADHQRWITFVVLPLMIVELATALMLWQVRPQGVSGALVVLGVVLLLIIWGSTFFLQVPQHSRLADGFDPDVCRRLVQGNWIRTVCWSLRGWLSAWMVWRVLNA